MLHIREYPLLNTPSLSLIVMRAAAEGAVSVEDCAARLQSLLQAANENPPVSPDEMTRRLDRLRAELTEALLLQPADGGRFTITERGRRALMNHPGGVDTADLMTYPEYADYVRSHDRADSPMDPHIAEYDEGFDAYRAGKRPTQNPYGVQTISHLAWENGWSEALDEEVQGPRSAASDQRPRRLR